MIFPSFHFPKEMRTAEQSKIKSAASLLLLLLSQLSYLAASGALLVQLTMVQTVAIEEQELLILFAVAPKRRAGRL
jgi:hypothetical protein